MIIYQNFVEIFYFILHQCVHCSEKCCNWNGLKVFFGKWEETSRSHLRKGFLKCLPYHTRFSWFYLLTQYRKLQSHCILTLKRKGKTNPQRLFNMLHSVHHYCQTETGSTPSHDIAKQCAWPACDHSLDAINGQCVLESKLEIRLRASRMIAWLE